WPRLAPLVLHFVRPRVVTGVRMHARLRRCPCTIASARTSTTERGAALSAITSFPLLRGGSERRPSPAQRGKVPKADGGALAFALTSRNQLRIAASCTRPHRNWWRALTRRASAFAPAHDVTMQPGPLPRRLPAFAHDHLAEPLDQHGRVVVLRRLAG